MVINTIFFIASIICIILLFAKIGITLKEYFRYKRNKSADKINTLANVILLTIPIVLLAYNMFDLYEKII